MGFRVGGKGLGFRGPAKEVQRDNFGKLPYQG